MSGVHVSAEHEFEAQYGLPEALPAGEKILWQGSPRWQSLAIGAFHVRKLAIYFAILLALRMTFALSDGAGVGEALLSTVLLLPLALFALGLVTLVAWLSARAAVYSITNKRVVMRVGVVLSVTFNLPFSRIDSAALKARGDGIGDIPLALSGTDRIAYLHLWPHARPWRVARPEPMLRSVPEVAHVAALLATAMTEGTGGFANVPAVKAADANWQRGAMGSASGNGNGLATAS